jgi:orotidine-5'-phosphate decarboxylase
MINMERNFKELLEKKWDEGKFLCVGLDADLEKIPESFKGHDAGETILNFNRAIIDATKDLVCAYKPNSAFYEAAGDGRFFALRDTISYIQEVSPEIPVILDAKRGDVGNTNRGYVESAFEFLKADAITVHPYLGREALEPFLTRKDKGIFVLCRTSNSGAAEFQNLILDGIPLYRQVAEHVHKIWNASGNCGLVVGATYPEEIREIRRDAPTVPFLIPGVGTQNGDLAKSVRNGKDARGRGFILSISRAIIFSDDVRGNTQHFDRAIRDALLQ